MRAEMAMERAERGAALLDEKRPGWEHEIDLAKLDLDSPCRCVLGQLYGGFSVGLTYLDLGLKSNSAESVSSYFGLSSAYGFAAYDDDDSYAELDEAWISILKRRYDLGVFSDTEPTKS